MAALLAGVGCAPNDLGTPCHLLRPDNTEAQPRPGHVVLQSGSGECEEFACVSFAGGAPVCSRPCTRLGDSCESGMVCRNAVLDRDTLDRVRSRLEGRDDNANGVDDFEEIAAGVTDPLFCGPPG